MILCYVQQELSGGQAGKSAQAETFREVPSPKFRRDTDYNLAEVLRGFPQAIQANSGIGR
jgi:hypothetical protein